MERAPALYEDIANLYIRVIKRDSPEAGAALEQIHATFGARAALRATLVLTVLKMEVKENYHLPDPTIFNDIFAQYPEAVLLLRQAVGHCLAAWGITAKEQFHIPSVKAQRAGNPFAAMTRTSSVSPG